MAAWLLGRQVRADGEGCVTSKCEVAARRGLSAPSQSSASPECWFSFAANGAERIQKKIDERLCLKKKMSLLPFLGVPAFYAG